MDLVDIPFRLKAYIIFLACSALPIVAWAGWKLCTQHYNPLWMVLAGLACVTIFFFLNLPHLKAAVTIGDAYIMAIAMMYDIAPCVVANFIYILLISLVSQRQKAYADKIHKIVFNVASTTCGAWLYSSIYQGLTHGNHEIKNIVVPAAIMTLVFFLFNSMATSIAISWAQGERTFRFWARTCTPLSLDYSLSGVCSTSMAAFYGISPFVPLGIAPLLGIAWGWNQINKSRAIEAQEHLEKQEQLYFRTVESLALAVDAKDQTTYGHIRRVKVYAIGLAKLCGIKDENELKAINTGALLHDIGKIAVEDYVLNKPGRLSKREYEKIKVHSTAGDEILQQVRFPYPVAKYVRHHHERWDGLGYPDGLKGEEIPLAARILSISDAFDAIRFSRPYKPPIPQDEAANILRSQSGTAYDPQLVGIFTKHMEELERAALKESEDAPQLSFRKYSEDIEQPTATSGAGAPRDIPAELIQLGEYCTTLFAYLPFNDIFPVLSQRLGQLVPFSTCVFFLSNGDDRITASYACGSFCEGLQGRSMEIGKGISGWVAAYKRPIINTEPALDFPGINAEFSSFKDALVVPITHEGECLGTISLYAQELSSYGQDHLNIVQTVAGFLAPLIAEVNKSRGSDSRDVVDPTTGLHRVSYLSAVGPQLISNAQENGTPASLLYIEIKNLAQIMRIFGSNLGNSTLKRIADCIRPELRETDILVRYGPQGYIAFLPGVRDDQAFRCSQRLKQRIKSDTMTSGQGFSIDCQTGISFCPQDGSTVLSLLKAAQENMRASFTQKSAPEGNVVGFPRA
jgi:diguanylate cyclase (GGDEF)-like protein/putative nucleotidyltransferase with HDIG domain